MFDNMHPRVVYTYLYHELILKTHFNEWYAEKYFNNTYSISVQS